MIQIHYLKILEFIQKAYGYFSSRKTREKFIKTFNREVEASKPRLQERKVAEARRNTYQRAQLLGVDLTNQGLEEFEREYTTSSAPINQVSTEEASSSNVPTAQIAKVPPETTCTLNKNKKTFVIYNTAAYLTSPNKPKIQYVDREQIKDFCDVAMEFTMDGKTPINQEVMEEFKQYSENQKSLASSDSFPGVADFLNGCIVWVNTTLSIFSLKDAVTIASFVATLMTAKFVKENNIDKHALARKLHWPMKKLSRFLKKGDRLMELSSVLGEGGACSLAETFSMTDIDEVSGTVWSSFVEGVTEDTQNHLYHNIVLEEFKLVVSD